MDQSKLKTLLIIVFVATAFSCGSKQKEQAIQVDYKSEMLAADREFSMLSEKKGIKKAMMHFIDNKGILLRPNSIPIIGGEAIDYISQANDSAYIMTWEPSGGNVAVSGELGYTYGVYSLKPKEKDTVFYGTYVSVWKRQPDGKWKFTLETGNEGIE